MIMNVNTPQLSSEKISEIKDRINYFLFEELRDEASGAEHYYKKAKLAHEVGETQLSSMLLAHSKEEVKHFKDIYNQIEKSIPDIKSNVLYPLLETFEEWIEDIEEKIVNFPR